jgi:MEDS: MEthanogen/methylotroph, DcmR Sensory domain
MASDRQVKLAGSLTECRCHVCALIARPQERHEVFLPFVAEGLHSDDRVVLLLDRHERADRMRLMIESGLDVDAAEREGRLITITWEHSYLQAGDRFDQAAMLDLVERLAVDLSRSGKLTRAWAEMAWAAGYVPGRDELIEYESRLNWILPKYDLAVVCAYDVSKFSSEVVVNLLHTHPHVVLKGALSQNPFYLPPDTLLPELSRRGAQH